MYRLSSFAGFALFAALPALADHQALTREQMADFLKNAKVIKSRDVATGVTNSRRLTLSDGTMTHDAHFQTIDQSMTTFQGTRGTELNFRDTWRYNVAAYKLAGLLGIEHMVPMSIERNIGGSTGAITWWCDKVKFDEAKRMKSKTDPPNLDDWNKQMHILRVFDQLIYNTDRNLGNLVITEDWNIVMIDHTRAFRLMRQLQNPKNLVRCEKGLLEKMKALDEASLAAAVKDYLNKEEAKAILARRDLIVKYFESQGPGSMFEMNVTPGKAAWIAAVQ
ncbi:MAG: hypothetical protein SFV18_08805 [Bryobacteraceae bacterium]|nr:hypothetical protein [Bryobacteraceae bacterium]